MPIKKINRQLLLDEATRLFRENGYHATSINDVANACKIKKASVYHYISGKEELVANVLEQKLEKFRKHIFSIAYDDDLAHSQRANAFSQAIFEYYNDKLKGCLMGNLALEIVGNEGRSQTVLKTFFKDFHDAIVYLCNHNNDEYRAEVIAQDVIAQIQGGLMLRALSHDDTTFKRSCEYLGRSAAIQ